MQLSPNFYLSEFTKSRTASKLGIDNTPTKKVVENLANWCSLIGEPVRQEFGRPVVCSSGYRSEELNRRLRGSKTSQHKYGEAVDFEVLGVSNYTVAAFIEKHLEFDQLILEFWNNQIPMSGWIHCSAVKSPEMPRYSVLRAVKVAGRTKYLKGLR